MRIKLSVERLPDFDEEGRCTGHRYVYTARATSDGGIEGSGEGATLIEASGEGGTLIEAIQNLERALDY